MPLNIQAIGKTLGPITRTYTWKDAVLYALGVGCGYSDLDYCYEKRLKILPTFCMAMIFDLFFEAAKTANATLSGILHGHQELIWHRQIPSEGAISTKGRIKAIYDQGKDKGAVILVETETLHSDGKKLFDSTFSIYARLDGGFGGTPAPKMAVDFPDRPPDVIETDHPAKNQPLIYRLSGDRFALHADPDFARSSGFEMPIMHGLCTQGYACRALIQALTPGKPQFLRRLSCRFTKPLFPGTPIETRIWKSDAGKAIWKTLNASTGEVVIDHGECEFGEISEISIRFDRQVAIITGAGAGLGRTYALELARRGASIIVNDVGIQRDGTGTSDTSAADAVVDEIRSLGGHAIANYEDIRKPESGEKIVQAAIESFGSVNILIHNAGIIRDKTLAKMDSTDWKEVIDVHLNGAFHVIQPVFRIMKEKGYGKIVLTSSAAGLYGNFGQSNYGAAKMGLVGLMNTLKLEGLKHNVSINTIAPVAASRLTKDAIPPEWLEQMNPEWVTPLVVYLCSKECLDTGMVFNVGMGCIQRVAVMTASGVRLSSGNDLFTPEMVLENWEKITALDDPKEISDAFAAIRQMMETPKKDGNHEDEFDESDEPDLSVVFESMKQMFDPTAAEGIYVTFQYKIAGIRKGEWIVSVKDKICTISKGISEKPSCTFKMTCPDFMDLVAGKLNPIFAFTTGKLKIEGDIMASQLLGKLFPMKPSKG